MVAYEIKQSENGVGKAYSRFMQTLSEHITLLARNGKPITSVMGIKRVFYRYRRVLTPDPSVSQRLTSPLIEGRTSHAHGLGMLVSEVMDKFDVDVSDAVEVGLVGENDIKKALAKYDYYHLIKQGMTGKNAKILLSKKYGFSVSMIEKLIYDRRNRKK